MSDFRKALFYFMLSQQTQSKTIAHMFMSWQNMIENKEFQTSVSLRFVVPSNESNTILKIGFIIIC